MTPIGARCAAVFVLCLTLGITSLCGCQYSTTNRTSEAAAETVEKESASPRVSISDGWLAMGTFFEVDLRVGAGEVLAAREWIEDAKRELVALEKIYSRHDSESELSALNRSLFGPSTTEFPASEPLAEVLRLALGVAQSTQGAFDPTIGPVVQLFARAAETNTAPTHQDLAAAESRVGFGAIHISPHGRVRSTKPGLSIDLDALGKGAALDRLRSLLEARFDNVAALLSFGQSSLIAIGDPNGGSDGSGWRLELRSRGVVPVRLGTVRLRNQALSMSSSRGSVYRVEGQERSHLLDGRNGKPIRRELDAVVVAKSAAIADAWSTALIAIGDARSEAVTRARIGRESESFEAIVFEEAGAVSETSGWRGAADFEASNSVRGSEALAAFLRP